MIIKPTDIAKYFQKLSVDDLQQIQDIGPTVAQSIFDWFHDEGNLELLAKLEGAGVKVETPKLEASGFKLQGKSFVLTGELDSMSRSRAKERIRALGGDPSGSVSKNTDFVVAGKNPGSKYSKAEKLGVRIIGEKEFLRMLGG